MIFSDNSSSKRRIDENQLSTVILWQLFKIGDKMLSSGTLLVSADVASGILSISSVVYGLGSEVF